MIALPLFVFEVFDPTLSQKKGKDGAPALGEKERQTEFGLQVRQLRDRNGSESSRFALGWDE